MFQKNKYILTFSCPDVAGIVAEVTGFLAQQGGFINESAQFGDFATDRFFMRSEFLCEQNLEVLKSAFTPIAQKLSMDWDIFDASKKPRALVMVTKAGHCFNHILYRHVTGGLNIEIPTVISNHKDLEYMANWHDIPFQHMPITKETKAAQEEALLKIIDDLQIDVVVLARYMQVLSPNLCEKLKGKAINIHHSFLPGFKGAKPYHQAYDRGVKIIGATAHYVTTDLDEGPIIEQEILRVDHSYKPEDLQRVGQDIEARVLSTALKYHAEHRVILNGNKTVVFN